MTYAAVDEWQSRFALYDKKSAIISFNGAYASLGLNGRFLDLNTIF